MNKRKKFFKILGYSFVCMLIYLCGAVLIIPAAFLVVNFVGDSYSWMCLIPMFLSLIISSIYRIIMCKKNDYGEDKISLGESVFYKTAAIELLFVLCGIIIIVLD